MSSRYLLKYVKEIPTNVNPWLALIQISGTIMVILAGMYHFSLHADLSINACKEQVGCISLHGLFMTYGFIFFQGEALINKRLHQIVKHEKQRLSIITMHIFHCSCTIVLAVIALIAIINHKKDNQQNNAYTFHSWIGIGIIVTFLAQGALGILNSGTTPNNSEGLYNVRLHKWLGLWLFEVCTIQALSGHVSLALDSMQHVEIYTHNKLNRETILLNLTTVFILFYSTAVNFFVVESRWAKWIVKDD